MSSAATIERIVQIDYDETLPHGQKFHHNLSQDIVKNLSLRVVLVPLNAAIKFDFEFKHPFVLNRFLPRR
jgi:hypothetical protein